MNTIVFCAPGSRPLCLDLLLIVVSFIGTRYKDRTLAFPIDQRSVRGVVACAGYEARKIPTNGYRLLPWCYTQAMHKSRSTSWVLLRSLLHSQGIHPIIHMQHDV